MKRTLVLVVWSLTSLATITASAATPQFSARRDYSDIFGPFLAAADLNGDGVPDLITNETGVLRVMFGNGNGTFRQGPTTVTILTGGAGFVVADVNGDGKADVLVAGSLNGIQQPQGIAVCLGNGDGTFQTGVLYPAGDGTDIAHLALGDFNGDGIPDIATAGASGVWLFTGKGDGTYNTAVLAVSLPASSGSLATADFNHDGKLDLVVTMPVGPLGSNGAGFAVLLGNGDGTFQTPSTFNKPIKAPVVAVGDLNMDGHPDIALTSTFSPFVYVYLGNGAGGFSGPNAVSMPDATGLAIGDVNGDGIPDLVNPGVYIALGKGDGTFKTPFQHAVVTADGTYNVALADLRNNGRTDIVTTSQWAVSVLLAQGGGKYEDGKWVPVPGGAGCGAVADYNRDGKPDLAVNTPQGVTILLGTGKASAPFTTGATMQLTGADCLVAGDVNGDGVADLLVPTATGVVTYLGKGDGTFSQKSVTATTTAGYLALGDFNHDGKLDFATSGNLLALGNGDGTFQAPVPIVSSPPAGGFFDVAAGDLNEDGWPDLVLSSINNFPLTILINNRQGGFSQSPSSFGQGTIQTVISDLNGDGRADLVLATYGGAWVYLGDGHGGFTYTAELVHPLAALGIGSAVIAADVNGDGIADVGVLESDSLAIYLGNGDGTFAVPFSIGTGVSPGDVLVGNFHGQTRAAGVPDIVAPDFSGGVTVLTNITK